MPAITATKVADGYRLSSNGVTLGTLFQFGAGWVVIVTGRSAAGRVWRRSRPYPSAEAAAAMRWGADAAIAVSRSRETTVAA